MSIFKSKKIVKEKAKPEKLKAPAKVVAKKTDRITKIPDPVIKANSSPEKEAYLQLLAKYEQQNPEKFAAKRDILLAKLNTL